ncbi:MAG: thioesterase superfamily protein [Streptosporangiaceae bacterium]|jgi:uncharacterized protein (TIGR00369 family)|nr:thioesterase superfamily protein [Streptosporangiaceae bacterium]
MGRSRTYEWQDPGISAAQLGKLPGLEFLREMAAGRLPGPPIASTLDFSIDEVEHGRVVFRCVPAEEHFNPIGSVHGGLYATLADSAAGCAVHSTLPEGMAYTSLDLSVKFLRPVVIGTGPIRAVGVVRNRGRRTALAEVEVLDANDRLLAHATSSCLLFPVPPEA